MCVCVYSAQRSCSSLSNEASNKQKKNEKRPRKKRNTKRSIGRSILIDKLGKKATAPLLIYQNAKLIIALSLFLSDEEMNDRKREEKKKETNLFRENNLKYFKEKEFFQLK